MLMSVAWTPLKMETDYQIYEAQELDIADLTDPLLLQVYNHWTRALAEKPSDACAPTPAGFKMHELPGSAISHMVVVDILSLDPFDIRYRFFGTEWVYRAGRDVTGLSQMADNIQSYGKLGFASFERVARHHRAEATHTLWRSGKGLMMESTAIRVPLSTDGINIDRALAVAVFHDEASD